MRLMWRVQGDWMVRARAARRLIVLSVLVACGCALLTGVRASTAYADGPVAIRYEATPPAPPAAADAPALRALADVLGALDVRGVPIELAIEYFSGCTGGQLRGSCTLTPARWRTPSNPPTFCTFQSNRPGSITADAFRDAVRAAVSAWSSAEAATGIQYTGDCATGFIWQYDNSRNEIGWDDGRNVAYGQEAGIARGSWIGTIAPRLIEFDIVLDPGTLANVPTQCFRSVVLHEVGHALGFGHSTSHADAMYESFDPSNLATCHERPSAAELSALRDLYGVNRAPSVTLGPSRTVDGGGTVVLSAVATDPDGDALTYAWRQTTGTAVALTTAGAIATFVAPAEQGAQITFEVTASDPYLHSATASVAVQVSAARAAPALPLTFDAFLPDAARSRAVIGWGGGPGASSWRFCAAALRGALATNCTTAPTGSQPVTWAIVRGLGGTADTPTRLDDWQYTSVAACNAAGCTPDLDGPITGGVRWAAWEIGYDYFAMAFDAAGLQFTVAGVVGLSGPSRTVLLWNGPAARPETRTFWRCSVGPGDVCIGFMGPADGRQEGVVEVQSVRGGTPTVLHTIPVR